MKIKNLLLGSVVLSSILFSGGDIGAGGADITYGASAGVIYTINDLMDVDVKYKATWVDYEEGEKGPGTLFNSDYFSYDTVTHALILGLNFKF